MHSGFTSLRSALTEEHQAHFPKHKVWARAQGDIERVMTSGRTALRATGDLSLRSTSMADAITPGRNAIRDVRREARSRVCGLL